MNLILFGFKSSGKTHFGKLLAHKLRRPFFDTDDLVKKLYGQQKEISQIYKEVGEASFRELEKQTLPILQTLQKSVVALGGGFVLNSTSMNKLASLGTLVYLKASEQQIKTRLFNVAIPSFLDETKPEESLHQLYCQRESVYDSIPAYTIDTDKLDEKKVLESLIQIWK